MHRENAENSPTNGLNKVVGLKTHTDVHLERAVANLRECAEMLENEPELIAGGGVVTITFYEFVDKETGLIKSSVDVYHTCDSALKVGGALQRAVNLFWDQ